MHVRLCTQYNEEKREDDVQTDEVESRERNERRARVKKAIKAVNQYTGFRRKAQNIFKHAIMSRRKVAVEYVKKLIVDHFNDEEVSSMLLHEDWMLVYYLSCSLQANQDWFSRFVGVKKPRIAFEP